MFQVLVLKISMNSSSVVLVVLLWMNWNTLQYICKLKLFTSIKFLIHIWYRSLSNSQLFTWTVQFAYSFFLWMHYTFVFEAMFFQMIICSIFNGKYRGTIFISGVCNTKKWLIYRNIKICHCIALVNSCYHLMIREKCTSKLPLFEPSFPGFSSWFHYLLMISPSLRPSIDIEFITFSKTTRFGRRRWCWR
jgi:hypothetical protein